MTEPDDVVAHLDAWGGLGPDAGAGEPRGASRSEPGFLLYPAIDVRRGRVVRLLRGDAARETVFGTDPRTTAEDLVRRGAARLHVVDLDGAFGEGSGGGAMHSSTRARAAARRAANSPGGQCCSESAPGASGTSAAAHGP